MRDLHAQARLLKRTRWILAVLLLLGSGVFYGLVYRPIQYRLTQLQDERESQEAELLASEARARNLPAVMHEVKQLRMTLERFNKQLPRQDDLAQFIDEITRISQQTALRDVQFKHGGSRQSEFFRELPVTFGFSGEFSSVFSFLRQAEDMQRLTRVRNIKIENRDARTGQVNVQLSMSIYFMEG
jgi:Tfp pilus assembly protein PilO